MPALPRVPTVQLWHSEVPTLAKVILPDAVQRMDHGQPFHYAYQGRVADHSPKDRHMRCAETNKFRGV